MYLYLQPKPKSKGGTPIQWTSEMINIIKEKFPNTFSIDIANNLNISIRSVIRKARQLGIEKEVNFLEKNKEEIQKRSRKNRPTNKTKGLKGWSVPNSESTRFKPGNIPPNKDPEILKKQVAARNETIRMERFRINNGLKQKTKLKLK